MPLTDSSSTVLAIAEIQADGAELELCPAGQTEDPFASDPETHTDHVGENGQFSSSSAVKYRAAGRNCSTGQFGPWNADDPGTPVLPLLLKAQISVSSRGIQGTLSPSAQIQRHD
jgi:hypothetical protein